jgi:hypothetical protein
MQLHTYTADNLAGKELASLLSKKIGKAKPNLHAVVLAGLHLFSDFATSVISVRWFSIHGETCQ